MRFLVLAPFLLFGFQALAYDTSGCSPMHGSKQSVSTPLHNSIQAWMVRANQPGCWNASSSSVAIEYNFMRKPGLAAPKVELWVKLNGDARSMPVSVRCHGIPNNYGASTETLCQASTYLPISSQGSIALEVAPSVDGVWDTAGYDQNSVFHF